MLQRRISAMVVLAALLGSLGLPWIADSHRFNDDPHWAIAAAGGTDASAVISNGTAGDESHCEVCHWLRTMRSADRVAPTTFHPDVRPVVQPASPLSRTAAASLRTFAARAPPALS